jgi:hypothetical protein
VENEDETPWAPQDYDIFTMDSPEPVTAFTELDIAIREEYSHVIKELKGLPPCWPHLGMGDFKIQLLPGLTPLYYHPYRTTPADITKNFFCA